MLTRHRTTRHFLATVAIATVASLLFALPAAATPDTTPAVEAECVEEAELEGDVECVVEEVEAPAATGTLYIRKTIRDDLQLANIADALENDLKKGFASHPNALTNTDYAGPHPLRDHRHPGRHRGLRQRVVPLGGRSNTYKASYTVVAGVAVTLSEADLAGWEEGTFGVVRATLAPTPTASGSRAGSGPPPSSPTPSSSPRAARSPAGS